MIQKPIYHHHIQKTGGTSINHAFCSLAFAPEDQCNIGMCEGETIYERICREPGHTITGNGIKITGHTQPVPGFTYAHSHRAVSDLHLPKGTFRFSAFRDPIERVISFYRNSLDISQREPHRMERCGLMHVKSALDNQDFGLFIRQVVPSYLSHQLWVFSSEYNVEDALRRIKALDCVLFTETLREDFKRLCEMVEVDLSLKLGRANKSLVEVDVTARHVDELRVKLAPEYKLIDLVRKTQHRKCQPWRKRVMKSVYGMGVALRNLMPRSV